MLRLRLARLLALGLLLGSGSAPAQTAAWLDGDPAAIWQRPPGFYQDGQSWYAIVHTRPQVARVRLAGDFTGGAPGAVDLTRTPDGKFWWWKGGAHGLARPPRAGDRYGFVLTGADGSETWTQDPAARRVESSDLTARSLVTVSADYAWHDQEFLDLGGVKQPSGKIIHGWANGGSYDEGKIASNTFLLEWPRGSGLRKEVPEIDRAGWFRTEEARKKILRGQEPFIDILLHQLRKHGYSFLENGSKQV